MSEPVQRVPGRFRFATRCCDRREYRFTPDKEMHKAFAVVMSDACLRYNVQLVAHCMMSNHDHALSCLTTVCG